MSEAYIFSSLILPAEEDTPAALCRKTGLRLERIDELHRINPGGAAVSAGLPVLDWPDAPLLGHFVLQHLCQEFAAARIELAVFTQANAGQTCAVLLGGPAVVGRYNLLPAARLTPLSALPGGEGFLPRVAAQATGLLPEDTRFTHLVGDVPQNAPAFFDAAAVLEEERGLLFQLHALLSDQAAWGLLLSQTTAAGLGTLVERI